MDQDIPDFDTLLKMAQQNPEELEELRAELILRTINQAPERLRPRLRGLQFQIDTKRRLAKTPMAACIQLSNMMHDSFAELHESLHYPLDVMASRERGDKVTNAEVLAFPSA